MSDIEKKYEEVEKLLKATFFDTIHKNFAVLDLSKISDPAINDLVDQQQKNINKSLGLLSALIRTVNDVKKTGEKISDFIVENALVDVGDFESKKADVAEVESSIADENVSDEVVTENVVVPVVDNNGSQNQQSDDSTNVIPTQDVVSPISNDVVEVPVVAPSVTDNSSEATSEEVNVEVTNNNNDAVVETPVAEVTSDFVLTPIDDGQVPIKPTESSVIPADNVEENTIESTAQAVPIDVKTQFDKTSQDPTRAILVSKVQIDKLAASREPQKAAIPLNAADEAGAIDPQVQVQQLMAQANQLYNEGRREEAQEIMNQISGMTKSLQTEETEKNGVTLQKKA